MHAAIIDNREAIAALCHRYGVVRLEVFGSAAGSEDFDPATSDADFRVALASRPDLTALEQFFGLKEALERELGRPVDLVEETALRNPYLRAAIDRSRALVYAA
ncbi:nucleotidyltransferase domain-containing protein [uncultured Rhodospira sp.]|uniref:nucleotidyltransferase family protein n=1 Tax=uncultured Rhodospira sp. TaxID=1936189 RepID=UPI0026203DAE|nr:nucleotidyltransferase domain-containing protein [uncultured Rhodospira sp.]